MGKKNRYNVVVSLLTQIVILALGLIIPRLYLTQYGSDVNGLIGTVTQIFTYMALLEAGIGQATKNALYPFIRDKIKNRENISEVMSISKRYYEKVSILYTAAVVLLSFLLPLVLESNLSYWNIFAIVLFEGAAGSISFFFIEKWSMLLAADGMNYITANIDFASKLISYSLKIIFALMGFNVVFIQVAYFVASLSRLLIYKLYMDKNYGWIDYKRKTNGSLKDRNSYIITEIAWTIFSSTDMIVLSIFCSTAVASVYSVYNMVFVAINSLLSAVYNSLTFNLGQVYHKNLEQYKTYHDVFNSIFVGLMTAFMSVTFLLINPFVELYTSGINDINYIYAELPFMFCVIQILSWSRYISGNLSGVAGYAKPVSVISLIEACSNIILSIVLVKKLGIIGVVAATVISLPIKVVYLNVLADKVIMKRSLTNTAKILVSNWALFGIIVMLKQHLSFAIPNFGIFCIYGVILSAIIGIIVLLTNVIINPNLNIYVKKIISRK